MEKIQEIERLVGEAMSELLEAPLASTQKRILTTLARKCAEINMDDFLEVNKNPLDYNARIRDGQVEEVKQEEKPDLQPLPEEMPLAIRILIGSEAIALDVWKWFKGNFGTQPREWWMNLKFGDGFCKQDGGKVFFERIVLMDTQHNVYPIDECSPYTDPTQSFREKLTPEMQVEFDKLMEGK